MTLAEQYDNPSFLFMFIEIPAIILFSCTNSCISSPSIHGFFPFKIAERSDITVWSPPAGSFITTF